MISPRWLAVLPLLALTITPACASNDAQGGAETGDDQDVTDVANSKVKDQSIGNCWVYATSAWAESLRLSYSGEEMNVSESFISYIDWFHGIQAGDIQADGLQTGGFFGEAVEYMRRYGIMDEGAFIPEEANSAESSRQKQALDAINASLTSGVLSDPAARKNRVKVREELDKAWKLSPQVVALLDQSFGHDLSRTLVSGATVPKGKGLRAPSELEVGFSKSKNKVITLADAIGAPQSETSSWSWNTRKGDFAWNETNYPTDATSRRSVQIKMQKALNARRPVVMSWYVDFNAMDRNSGTFKAPPATPGHAGGHMTVMEDYQVSNVPGFGTLAAGVTITDPKALAAALAPEAKLDFLRIKNSWGTGFSPPAGTELFGYHDLYMDYLNANIPTCDTKDAQGKCTSAPRRGLTSFVLPSDAWADVTAAPTTTPQPPQPSGGTCAHALCSGGGKLDASCDPCAKKICDADAYCCTTSWDSTCVKEVASICGQTCSK